MKMTADFNTYNKTADNFSSDIFEFLTCWLCWLTLVVAPFVWRPSAAVLLKNSWIKWFNGLYVIEDEWYCSLTYAVQHKCKFNDVSIWEKHI